MSATPISKLPPVPAIQNPDGVRPSQKSGAAQRSAEFRVALEHELAQPDPVTFSAHAQSRLLSRNIQLNDAQMERLNLGVSQAAGKGARDSLVLLDQLALIVSVQNRRVITAVDSRQFSGSVFTQIDSAVIV